jgi:hypothetical protein
MKIVLLTCVTLIVLLFSAAAVNAQVPLVQIVFDESLTQQTKVCTIGETDSAFVIARNFESYVTGIEFAISYPAGIAWQSDSGTPLLVMGNTKTGISMVWQNPLNGFFPLKLCTIHYKCNNCLPDTPIAVIPHPVSGYVRGVSYPSMTFIYAIGWTSIFCPDVIPVEQTSWGQVKALYED